MKQCLETHCEFRGIFIYIIMPNKLPQAEFEKRIYEKFGNKIDLSGIEYEDLSSEIKPSCHIHGRYPIIAKRLLQYKNPCPKCGPTHKLTYEEIIRLGNLKHNNQYEYPEINLPFKDNKCKINIICKIHGKYPLRINNWHYSKKLFRPGYHPMKSNLCKEKGIRLLHIREDLWIKNPEKMKEIILKFLEI